MRAVVAIIGADVAQFVGLPPFLSVGPDVRPPQEQRRLAGSVIQRLAAANLVFNEPANGKRALIGVRLRIELGGGVTRVTATGNIYQLEIRKSLFKHPEDDCL